MPPKKRALSAVPDVRPEPQHERAPDLRDAVLSSFAAMPWLTPAEDALKALAMRQAEELEKVRQRADEIADAWSEAGSDMGILQRLAKLEAATDAMKLVGWLGPQLQRVMVDLGGSPKARAEFGSSKPIGGRLAQLRAAAERKDDT